MLLDTKGPLTTKLKESDHASLAVSDTHELIQDVVCGWGICVVLFQHVCLDPTFPSDVLCPVC